MLKVDDDLIYIMTVEKKTSPKGVKYGKPFFFVHNFRLNEPYGFYSPKATGYVDYLTVSFVKIIVDGMLIRKGLLSLLGSPVK